MTRTSSKDIQRLVDLLNKLTDSPAEPWAGQGATFKANVGCFHIEHAYGAPRLVRMVTEGGGERDISPRLPNGELARWINAYIAGFETAKRG